MNDGSSSSPSSPRHDRDWPPRSPEVKRDRPLCFKLEQRLRALKSPEIREALRAALRARATSVGEISYSKQGCTLTPGDDGSWPDIDGQGEEAGSKLVEGEAGPSAEFLVLRALGRAEQEQIQQLCRQLMDMDYAVVAVTSKDPMATYLVGFSSQTQQIAEALVNEGHALRPGNEVCGEPNPNVLAAAGLSSLQELHLSKGFKPQDLERFAGAWAEVEETLNEHETSGGDANGAGGATARDLRSVLQRARRLRFVSRHGLFAELHFHGERRYRAVAGCFTFKDESCWASSEAAGAKVSAVRRIAVDTEPMRVASDASHRPVSEVCEDELHDITEGVSWRRIASGLTTPIAAAELLMEQALQGGGSKTPVFGLRAGVWIVCGEASLQVLGPPRGEGLIGGTMCQNMEQLHLIEHAEALNDELHNRYEGSTGMVTVKGCITRDRGVGAAGNAKGSLLCGATPKSEIGFKTASILYSTGLMTKGGSITLESPSGSFTQVWRIRELEDNPFDSPSLRAARKIPTGRIASPTAAVVRVASMPKGKGKGKGKSKGRSGSRPPAFASVPIASEANFRPIGAVYSAQRAPLSVYGGAPSRLGSRPPGRPIGTLKVDASRSKGKGRKGDKGSKGNKGSKGDKGNRSVALDVRRRSRSVRREPQGYRGHAPRDRDYDGSTSRRHRSRSQRSLRSRSRRRGRKP